jgi:hypothetical protein
LTSWQVIYRQSEASSRTEIDLCTPESPAFSAANISETAQPGEPARSTGTPAQGATPDAPDNQGVLVRNLISMAAAALCCGLSATAACAQTITAPVYEPGTSVVPRTGTGIVEAVLPVQTNIANGKGCTASCRYTAGDLFKKVRRSNSGSAMTDTLPPSTASGIVNGARITIGNVDATAKLTIKAGAGTTIAVATVAPGRTLPLVYDLANTAWRIDDNAAIQLLLGSVTPVAGNAACYAITGQLQDCGTAPGIVLAPAPNGTDDTANLQRSYDFAAGRELIIGKGTFKTSGSLNFNVAGQRVTGAGVRSTNIQISTAANDVIAITATDQIVSNLEVSSSVAAARRTGNGISITGCLSCKLDAVNAVGHNIGIYATNAPAGIIRNSYASGNKTHGIMIDAWAGSANTGNINEFEITQTESNSNGASGFYLNGGTNSIGVSMVRPTAAGNVGSGITLNNPDGNPVHAVRDVWITQPEMSANGNGNTAIGQIDASKNTDALSLTIDGGGLIECVGQSGYGIITGSTKTVQIGNVPILQCLTSGIYVNGVGANISGTSLSGNATQIELGAASSGVVLGDLQGDPTWGTSAVGLKVDAGAAPFRCTSVDFSSSTAPTSGSLPAGSRTWGCANFPDNGNLNADNISSGNLAAGRMDNTAWTTFAPSLSCGTATFTLGSARFKTWGKTTHWSMDFTVAAIGSCAGGVVSFTLPNTPESGAGGGGEENATAGVVVGCTINASSTAADCRMQAALAAGSHLNVSGVYENQ